MNNPAGLPDINNQIDDIFKIHHLVAKLPDNVDIEFNLELAKEQIRQLLLKAKQTAIPEYISYLPIDIQTAIRRHNNDMKALGANHD